MGREVRMVPKGWEHTKDKLGRYMPLFEHYDKALAQFEADVKADGMREALTDHGGGPNEYDYMLVDVPESECTQYMMYECTSEGTPLSPAFETQEELAKWLVNNKASTFADSTGTYEQWLATIKRGSSVSAVMSSKGLQSGVEAGC